VGELVDAARIPEEKPLDGLTIQNVKGDCEKGISIANVVHAELKAR
jgi:hypothetical protein